MPCRWGGAGRVGRASLVLDLGAKLGCGWTTPRRDWSTCGEEPPYAQKCGLRGYPGRYGKEEIYGRNLNCGPSSPEAILHTTVL
jgi:hypothetical protein